MEPEDITGIPAVYRGFVEGMRQATKQKWREAVTAYFARAIINNEVALACQAAGFHDASVYFAQKSIWLLAQGVDCYGKMLKV